VSEVARCGDCGLVWPEDKLPKSLYQVHHLADRLDPGSTVPAGECSCGALAYLEEVADEPLSGYHPDFPSGHVEQALMERVVAKKVMRWIVTHVGPNGRRRMTFARQGCNTYASSGEAWKAIAMLHGAGGAVNDLKGVYGAQALGTFEPRRSECWASNNDPVNVYHEESEGE